MKKILLPVCLMLLVSQLSAQEKDIDKKVNNEVAKTIKKVTERIKDTIKKWKSKGEIAMLFNQTSFKNWTKGGQNSLSANLSFKYFLTYTYKKITWDNRFIFAYGFTNVENSDFNKKTQDIININSTYGLKMGKYTYASVFASFLSQFAKGYKYSKKDGKEIRTENSDFMSPGNLKFGLGILYKKSDNFKVNFSPIAASLIFVDKKYTLPDGKYYGVKEGESQRTELGANLEAYLKFVLVENVSVEQIASFYANYLQYFGNIDIFYTLTINMEINKFLSSNFVFDTVYNDNAYAGFQLREVIGLGINYNF